MNKNLNKQNKIYIFLQNWQDFSIINLMDNRIKFQCMENKEREQKKNLKTLLNYLLKFVQ